MTEYEIDEIGVKSTIEGFSRNDAEYVLKAIRRNEMLRNEMLPIANVVVVNDKNGAWCVNYDLIQPKFERIRRITGYLTGRLDSWNNAKRAEESERVKHDVES